MPITRRQFAQVIGCSIVLALLGCADDADDSAESGVARRGKLELPDDPFLVGDPQQYREPGVYQSHRQSHGIWLVSDGRRLVALSAVCTHKGCGTRYDSMSRVFKCPCDNSTFTTDGLNHSGSTAKRPLERCRISVVRAEDGTPRLKVDPTTRYRQDLDNPISGRNWSSPHSVYLFEPAEG
jgi:Rieske Fe-S protein